jgi:hypothetical protein
MEGWGGGGADARQPPFRCALDLATDPEGITDTVPQREMLEGEQDTRQRTGHDNDGGPCVHRQDLADL